MSWIWVKLISGLIFVLIPGFSLRDNFLKHPVLTVLSLLTGFFLLFLSLKPLVQADKHMESIQYTINQLKQSEQERIDREKIEEERLAKERAEKERLAKEKAEEERLAKERAEKERLAKERAEKERLAKEKAEKERLAKEKAEKERLAKEKAEKERLAKEKAEKEHLAKEKAEKKDLLAINKGQKAYYFDHGDGTITDTQTGLMWKKCTEGQKGESCVGNAIETIQHDKSKFDQFAEVTFAGYKDWRIPTKEELLTLVFCGNGVHDYRSNFNGCGGNELFIDKELYNKMNNPTINNIIFPNTKSGHYWSSSLSNTEYGTYNFSVGFDFGMAHPSYGGGAFVRLVRN